MGTIKFIILINSLFFISYAQITLKQNNLYHQRTLEINLNESILIGFDNYTEERKDTRLKINFNTYYIIKSNLTKDIINEIFKTTYNISSRIYDNSDIFNDTDFVCTIYEDTFEYSYCDNNNNIVFIIKYKCCAFLHYTFYPKKVNITSDLSKIDFSNFDIERKISPFAYAMQNDLISMKNIIIFNFADYHSFRFLKEGKIIQSNRSYFKIRGHLPNLYNDGCYNNINRFESENIRLIVMNNAHPALIQCKGYWDKDKEDDKYYYYLETTEINPEINSSLQYSITNFTKQNKTIMLDFANTDDSWIYQSQQLFRKTTGRLSTDGIIAVIIPCILILLGVVVLAYFLTRKFAPLPSPHLKNIAINNTIGNNSEAGILDDSKKK